MSVKEILNEVRDLPEDLAFLIGRFFSTAGLFILGGEGLTAACTGGEYPSSFGARRASHPTVFALFGLIWYVSVLYFSGSPDFLVLVQPLVDRVAAGYWQALLIFALPFLLIVALQAFLLRGFLSSMQVDAPYEYLYAATCYLAGAVALYFGTFIAVGITVLPYFETYQASELVRLLAALLATPVALMAARRYRAGAPKSTERGDFARRSLAASRVLVLVIVTAAVTIMVAVPIVKILYDRSWLFWAGVLGWLGWFLAPQWTKGVRSARSAGKAVLVAVVLFAAITLTMEAALALASQPQVRLGRLLLFAGAAFLVCRYVGVVSAVAGTPLTRTTFAVLLSSAIARLVAKLPLELLGGMTRYSADLAEEAARKAEAAGTAGCVVSTACARALGLPDDCRQLTVLRRFRDDYLFSTPKGRAEVERYYELSGPLLAKLRTIDAQEHEYRQIMVTLVEPTVRLVEEGRLAEALGHYQECIERMLVRYGVDAGASVHIRRVV